MVARAIRTRGLSKRYGSTTAVADLDLDVESGVVYGFLGPNGAGKTTTMSMLSGLIDPSAGWGEVADVPIEDRADLVDRIGLLPEEPPLYLELTGREQLRFAADVRGLEWQSLSDRALALCSDLELTEDLDRRIESYSKGMRQKVAFVQAVMHEPAVAFLDEPTSGLDPRAARTLRELIVDLARADTTVFLSTHILPVVEEIADVVGVLYDGRLVAEGSPGGLVGQVGAEGEADLEDAFLELTGGDSLGR